MYIRELDLENFGKFSGRKIAFEKGLNIIYGENESGKSTVHSFINGLLFGFLKPGVKSSIYTADHARYLPWSNSGYKGRMIVVKGGESYVIERNFSKGSEFIKVYNETTGEDITGRIKLGPSNRIFQPGYEFLGVGSSVFNNSISVRQKGIDTDSALADEIRERLVNASSGGDETVSVDRALKSLERQIKDIGTKRSANTRYGLASSKLDELNLKLSDLSGIRTKYNEFLKEHNELNRQYEKFSEELMSTNTTLEEIRLWNKKNLLDRAADLVEEIKALDDKIIDLEPLSNANETELESARRISSEIEISRLRLSGHEEKRDEFLVQASKLYSKDPDEINKLDAIVESGYHFSQLDSTIGTDTRQVVEDSIAKSSKLRKRSFISAILFGTVYLSGIVYFLSTRDYVAAILFQFLLPGTAYLAISAVIASKAITAMNKKLELIEKKEKILIDFGKSSSMEFRNAFERAKMEKARLEEDQKLKTELQTSLNALEERRREELDELDSLEREISSILIRSGSSSLEDLKTRVTGMKQLRELELERGFKNRELRQLIGIKSAEEITNELNELSRMVKPEALYTEEQLLEKSNDLETRAGEAAYKMKELEGRIAAYEERLAFELELLDEKSAIESELNSMETERSALELAAGKIERLSGEIHREFAPEINKRIGEVLKKLTDGCYEGARVDKNLNTNIISRAEGKMLSIESLSGGTVDQLYLSLRMGLLNDLVAADAPIFLDECFSQYDDSRLKRTLEFLSEQSEKRQIIIFTCQKREVELLQEMGISHRLINL